MKYGYGDTKYCYKNETSDGWLTHRKQSHFSTDILGAVTISNALCLPDKGLIGKDFMGGVYRNDGTPIENSFQRNGFNTAELLLKKSNLNNVEKVDKSVVYLGQYRRHYGSFLIDSISRLWYVLEDPEKYEYVYLATQTELGIGLHSSAVDFLKMFGILKEQIIIITEPTIYTSMIIPDMSYVPLKVWHQEFLDIVYKVVRNVGISELPPMEKVYFSRSKFSDKLKSDFGERFIVEFFRANGYEIIYPEEHSLAEQIYYVNHCKVFASIGGSCAHNILFSRTRPKMILFNRMNGYQFHQWYLNEMAGVEPIIYVDAYNEPYHFVMKTGVSGPFLYWLNKNVKRFAADYNMVIPRIPVKDQLYCFVRYSYYAARKICKNIISYFKRKDKYR